MNIRKYPANAGFQPTRPLRGATTLLLAMRCLLKISTHAPLAGRDLLAFA